MRLSKIQAEILNLLFKQDFISGNYLNGKFALSPKTIRKEISELNEKIRNHGLVIVSKSGTGYQLEVNDDENADSFRYRFLEFYNRNRIVKDNREYQIEYIARRFLVANNKYLTVEQLSMEVYCSESVMSHLIKDLRQQLSKFSLSIVTRPNYGMILQGSIVNRIIATIYYHKKFVELSIDEQEKELEFKRLFELSGERKKAIKQIIIQNLQSEDEFYSIPLIYLRKIYFCIVYALHSDIDEFTVDHNQMPLIHNRLFNVCTKIVDDLGKETNHFFSRNFCYVLYVLMIVYGSRVPKECYDEIIIKETFEISKRACNFLNKSFLTNFFNNDFVVNRIARKLKKCCLRKAYNIPYDDEVLSKLKDANILILDICSTLAYYLKTVENLDLSYNEWKSLYFVLYDSGVHVYDMNQKNILLSSVYGRHYAEGIKKLIAEKLNYPDSRLDVCEIHELANAKYQAYDFLLTDGYMDDMLQTNLPVLRFDGFDDYKNMMTIELILSYQMNILHNLNSYFPQKLYYYLKVNDKEELFEEIFKTIESDCYLPDGYKEEILDKESIFPAYRYERACFITTIKPYFDESFVSIYLLDKRIKYDGDKIDIVFVFNKGRFDSNIHAAIYNIVQKLLHSNDLIYLDTKRETWNMLMEKVKNLY